MSDEKKNPLVYLFGKTWQYSEDNRRNVVLCWTMFVIAELIDVFLMPMVWAKMVDVVTTQGVTEKSIRMLDMLLGIVFARVFVNWSLHGPARVMECINAFKARVNYRRFLYKGLLMLPLDWHTDHHSGDTIDKSNKGTNAIYDSSEDSFEIIYCLVRLIGCYGMLAYFSHISAFIIAMMMTVSVCITMRFDKILFKNYKELNKSENQISESVFDAISNISTVIILRVERLVFAAIMRKVEEPFDLAKCTYKLNEWKWFLTSVCCCIMTITVLRVYLWQHLGAAPGVLSGSFYLLWSYLNKIGDLFFRFCGMYGDVIKRKTRIMNSEELAQDFVLENFTNHVLPANWQKLEIENLNFSYKSENEDTLHLKDVSLTVHRGERIALVGGSGGGKSTLLALIRGLHSPRTLTLSVDGKIISEGFNGIKQAITLVPQNPEIFSSTILVNATMHADYERSTVVEATDMACFTDVVRSLPKGFDSSIKEKGVNLSGGQKQRLALARGFLACAGEDKSIALFDEPTSSLDAENMMEVFARLFEGFKDKTIIVSTHNLNLLALFDRVCLIDEGRIIASGTFRELLSGCSEFQALWQSYMKHQQEGVSEGS